jgi:hypothetical protein
VVVLVLLSRILNLGLREILCSFLRHSGGDLVSFEMLVLIATPMGTGHPIDRNLIMKFCDA